MAQTLSGRVKTTLTSTYLNALAERNVTDPISLTYQKDFTNGTGAGKGQVEYYAEGTLAAATNTVTIDLQALPVAFGTASLTKIKYFYFRVATTTTGFKATVDGGAANPFTAFWSDPSDIEQVYADGEFSKSAWTDGFVVDATHKTLRITHLAGGAPLSYDLYIIGEGTVA
jgi:hypothetical protein